MQDFILNIDNKEILIEILHHAVDHLIESSKSHRLASTKFSNKFGFANPNEFEAAVRFIADAYRRFALKQLDDTELVVKFAHLSVDLQQSVVDVIRTRLPEVQEWLLVEYNGREAPLVRSFDWDVKMVMGSSSLAALRQLLVTLVLQCRPEGGGGSPEMGDQRIAFEMDRAQVQKTIVTLEECLRQMDDSIVR